jgi:hypothetical protein
LNARPPLPLLLLLHAIAANSATAEAAAQKTFFM